MMDARRRRLEGIRARALARPAKVSRPGGTGGPCPEPRGLQVRRVSFYTTDLVASALDALAKTGLHGSCRGRVVDELVRAGLQRAEREGWFSRARLTGGR